MPRQRAVQRPAPTPRSGGRAGARVRLAGVWAPGAPPARATGERGLGIEGRQRGLPRTMPSGAAPIAGTAARRGPG
eukprot:9818177-Alexandrium_andersonii.AAC.1